MDFRYILSRGFVLKSQAFLVYLFFFFLGNKNTRLKSARPSDMKSQCRKCTVDSGLVITFL